MCYLNICVFSRLCNFSVWVQPDYHFYPVGFNRPECVYYVLCVCVCVGVCMCLVMCESLCVSDIVCACLVIGVTFC